jgi:hypothetical protein
VFLAPFAVSKLKPKKTHIVICLRSHGHYVAQSKVINESLLDQKYMFSFVRHFSQVISLVYIVPSVVYICAAHSVPFGR